MLKHHAHTLETFQVPFQMYLVTWMLIVCRNSWSTHWGDGGYVAVSREHHACGITTSPMYAIVADD